MKKILLCLAVIFCTLSANAQFEKGKWYTNASATGLDFNVNDGASFGFELNAGHFLLDDFAVLANLGGEYGDRVYDHTGLGVGVRYFTPIGIYIGGGLNFDNYNEAVKDANDFGLKIEAGYVFFLNQYITVEPGLYYRQSFVNHNDYSRFGIKVGFGVYF